jgi:hypothetical protein
MLYHVVLVHYVHLSCCVRCRGYLRTPNNAEYSTPLSIVYTYKVYHNRPYKYADIP